MNISEPALHTLLMVSRTFDLILLPVLLWIIASAITYGLRTGKWKETCSCEINRTTLYTACVVSMTALIPRLVLTQVLFMAPDISQNVTWCEEIMDAGSMLYFIPAYSTYFFLWMKQRALYSHPAIQRLTGKGFVVISKICMLMISLVSLAICVQFMLPEEYDFEKEIGCVLNKTEETHHWASDTAYYALFGASLGAQLGLLILFIYPIVKSSASEIRLSSRVGPACCGDAQSRACNVINDIKRIFVGEEKNDHLINTIRRSAACTAMAIFSDIAAMAIVALVIPQQGIPRSISNVPYDAGLVINALCVLATFRQTKNTLSVVCRRNGSKDFDEEEASFQQNTSVTTVSFPSASNSVV